MAAERCDFPFHVGMTATGPADQGLVRSAVAIGALLLDRIGDTIRVSLTGSPHKEVEAAYEILSAAGLRQRGPDPARHTHDAMLLLGVEGKPNVRTR